MRVKHRPYQNFPLLPRSCSHSRGDEAHLTVGYRRLIYCATAAAAKMIASEWGGRVEVEFEVDDQSGRLIAIHLSPPADDRGWALMVWNSHWRMISIPISAVERAWGRSQVVEERIGDGEIVITVPLDFGFTPPRPEDSRSEESRSDEDQITRCRPSR